MNLYEAIYIKTFFFPFLYVVASTADYKSFDVGDREKSQTSMGDLEQ